jgi:hypothetical protein
VIRRGDVADDLTHERVELRFVDLHRDFLLLPMRNFRVNSVQDGR